MARRQDDGATLPPLSELLLSNEYVSYIKSFQSNKVETWGYILNYIKRKLRLAF